MLKDPIVRFKIIKRIDLWLRQIPVSIYLIAICCIGIFLRTLYINHNLWMDELTTAWVIDGSFSEIFKRCWINNLSPLYYILTYIPKVCFGFSESSLRLPSIIPGIFTIPLIYLITHKLLGSQKLSILAAFLSSIDPTLIYYSYDVRPYALVIFFTTLHLYLFLFFLQREKKVFFGILLGFLSTFIILLHYTAAPICIVEIFIAFIYYYRKKSFSKQLLYGLLACTIIPGLLLLPFLSHIKYLLDNNHILGSFITKQKIETIFTIQPHLASFILFPFIVGFFVDYFFKKKSNFDHYKNFAFFFLIAWYIIPASIHWLFTEIAVANIFYPRYLAWIIPAPIIGSVLLLGTFSSRSTKMVVLIALIFFSSKLYFKSIVSSFSNKKSPYSIESVLTDDDKVSGYSWKKAVTTINNSGLHVNKVFVLADLTEAKKLNAPNQDPLLKSYLLSTVNSIYKLEKELLEKTLPIRTLSDIPDTLSNYIVIGDRLTISKFNIDDYLKNRTELSPKDNKVTVFYIK